LDEIVFAILNYSIEHGETYIITNAAPGWVEYSAKRFYPNVSTILNKIKIVSARGEFEKKYPGETKKWKILAFLETLKYMNTNLITNLICFGDSSIEMEAAQYLFDHFSKAFIKTVKFKEDPKPDECIKQLQLVLEQFPKICAAIKNLTIRVEKKEHIDNED